jgi:hypothetical protein
MLSALVDVFESADGERSTKLRGVARRALTKDAGREGVWTAILDATAETFAQTDESWENVASIGATIPGVADPSRGYWVYAPFSGIADFPLADELRAQFGKPVFADNDVNACAWAEKVFGACQGVDNFVWITISNGIGGGLVGGAVADECVTHVRLLLFCVYSQPASLPGALSRTLSTPARQAVLEW